MSPSDNSPPNDDEPLRSTPDTDCPGERSRNPHEDDAGAGKAGGNKPVEISTNELQPKEEGPSVGGKTEKSGSIASSVSPASVSRMALYLRELRQLEQRGVATVQSKMLGQQLGLSDSQIRRDLSVFNLTGRRGVGYNVANLIKSIRSIMGTDRSWDVILVGMGNLGRALAGYRGFGEQSFRLIAALDTDPGKIGTRVGDLVVQDFAILNDLVAKTGVGLSILAVPSDGAQKVAQQLADAGIHGILNFAPVTVRPKHKEMAVVDVDLALELQRLAFAVVNQTDKS